MAYFVLGPIFVTACLIICRLSIWLLEPILEIVLEYMGAQRAVDIIREANMKRVHPRAPQPQVQNQVKNDCSPSLDDVAHDMNVFRQRDIFLRTMVLASVVMGKIKEIETFDMIGPKNWKLKLADSKQRLGTWEQYYSSLIRRQPPTSRVRRLVESWLFLDGYGQGKHQCKAAQGCCARGCGCCQKPRGMILPGELYYSHCTTFCLCCTRARGFTKLSMDYTFRVKTNRSLK